MTREITVDYVWLFEIREVFCNDHGVDEDNHIHVSVFRDLNDAVDEAKSQVRLCERSGEIWSLYSNDTVMTWTTGGLGLYFEVRRAKLN